MEAAVVLLPVAASKQSLNQNCLKNKKASENAGFFGADEY